MRHAYGWSGDFEIFPGPRGALGQIWRVHVGSARYALKEIFAEPPSPEQIETELAFTRTASAAGVRIPVSHPDRAGRYLLTTAAGTWLRVYDWLDLGPVAPDAEALGALLARLHRCASGGHHRGGWSRPLFLVPPGAGPPGVGGGDEAGR